MKLTSEKHEKPGTFYEWERIARNVGQSLVVSHTLVLFRKRCPHHAGVLDVENDRLLLHELHVLENDLGRTRQLKQSKARSQRAQCRNRTNGNRCREV